MTLVELIEALEQATRPDRELDAEIARVAWGASVKWKMANYTMDLHLVVHWVAPHPYAGMKEPCPSYTSSIDAALTLVPERCLTGIRELWDSDGKAAAATVSRYTAPPNMMWDWEWHGFAPTPAIALCIAALKARAT